jgi:hypothetical protein
MSEITDTGSTTRARRRAMTTALTLVALLVACERHVTGIGTAGSPTPDASLRALTISAGTLTPAFDSAKTSYAVAVTTGTASITVTPTATSSGSTIVVNGAVVASGAASADIPLPVGTTTILVVVTDLDGITARTYTLTVVRAATDRIPIT